VTLPSKHTHTVKQLFAHLSCVKRYDGPEPSSGHYVRAIDALPQIWNASFFSPCTLGTTRYYSTHGFTYIAAVLEKVTGRRSAQLIRSEIAVPHRLSTMRALWASSSVPSNYDRAIPYRNNNTATTTSDNSWKIFGGGIEVSTVDLARFGWKVLNGNIVSASARDDVLWKRVRSNRRNGIAWEVRTVGGRRVAEHGGSWTGALTRLRVYRDDGLVIAIMSNRRNHTVGSLSSLASAIANEVLGAA
jgi:CubicO group peptidase (beta-lactamase class C family)